MAIDIAAALAQQIEQENRAHSEGYEVQDASSALKSSLEDMDRFLKGEKPDYIREKIKIYSRAKLIDEKLQRMQKK